MEDLGTSTDSALGVGILGLRFLARSPKTGSTSAVSRWIPRAQAEKPHENDLLFRDARVGGAALVTPQSRRHGSKLGSTNCGGPPGWVEELLGCRAACRCVEQGGPQPGLGGGVSRSDYNFIGRCFLMFGSLLEDVKHGQGLRCHSNETQKVRTAYVCGKKLIKWYRAPAAGKYK